MPFTFAHPAAVIPLHRLARRYTLLSALVAGSIAPDFQYFLPVDLTRNDTHSLAALIWFCLPVGMALYLLFHLVLKAPLRALLPNTVQIRLPIGKRPLPPASGAMIAASLLLGALTHLAWDACTHANGWVVRALPLLQQEGVRIAGHPIALYKLLQHGTAVIGLSLLAWWALQWLRRATPADTSPSASLAPAHRMQVLAILIAAPMMIGAWSALSNKALAYGHYPASEFVRDLIINGIGAFNLLLLAYSLLWQIGQLRRRS